MMSPQQDLGVSTAGNRTRKQTAKETFQRATSRALEQVEHESLFYSQVRPNVLPTFQSSEIGVGAILGKGEFGEVVELTEIHMMFECPCDSCGDDLNHTFGGTSNTLAATDVSPVKVQIIVDGEAFPKQQETANPAWSRSINNPSDFRLSPYPHENRHHQRASSIVSFAEDVKLPKMSDIDPNPPLQEQQQQQQQATLTTTAVETSIVNVDNVDESTLSTFNDEESATKLFDEEDTDGEGPFLKGYMSTHLVRQGVFRYAVKRIRPDLKGEMQLAAVVDLAVEAKFLASIRHPNIVKMRGTVGTPGSLDFRIIMDRLNMTLREKMTQWNAEPKGKTGFLRNLISAKKNEAHLREQYADKLLAVYDVARAVKYLHNHMIIFRDLKPENIGLDVRGDMRLFDFGLVKELKAKDLVEPPDSFHASGLTGSRRYMAPEVAACKNYGLKADVYSFAIVFWEVFSGTDAYQKMSFDKHFDQVVIKGKRPDPRLAAKATPGLSKSLLHLMPEMWSANPKDRPTFANICDRIAGECVLSSIQGKQAGFGRSDRMDSDLSHQSHLTDRTRYLMNRSLHSQIHSVEFGGDATDSLGPKFGPQKQ